MDKGLEAHPFEYIVYFQSSKWWLEVGWSGGPLPPYAFWDMAARKVIIKDSGYYELDLLDNSLIEKEIENQKNGMGIERYWITGHPNPEIQKIYEKFSSSFRLIN
jgi:hypothetical protein